MEFTIEQNICLVPYAANTIPADALATVGGHASSSAILDFEAGIWYLQYRKFNSGYTKMSDEPKQKLSFNFNETKFIIFLD